MSKILLSLTTCLCLLQLSVAAAASPRPSPDFPESGYQIRVTLKPYQNSKIYLGYYYGKIRALADSATLDAGGTGVFRGKERLTGGVYFLVSPSKAVLFELLIDSQQHFSLSADTTNLPGSVTFTGSPDNTVFQEYTVFTNGKGKEIQAGQQSLAKARSKADSARIRDTMKKLNTDIQQYRENILLKYPNSLLSTLFHTLKEPVVPP